jgi:rubrerythrin
VEPGQKFCGNCGNPPEGIVCPHCGKLSHFDFCPNCQTPLTEQATATIELVRNSTEIQDLLRMRESLPTPDPTVSESSTEQPQENPSEKFARYLAKVEKQQKDEPDADAAKETDEQQAKSTFEEKSTFADVSKNIDVAARARKEAEEQQQNTILEKQQEEKAKELLQKLREKQFKDNQEARRFYGALEVILPVLVQKKKKVKIGWQCNAFGVIHQQPQECAKAESGGIWLYDEITEHETKLQKKTL